MDVVLEGETGAHVAFEARQSQILCPPFVCATELTECLKGGTSAAGYYSDVLLSYYMFFVAFLKWSAVCVLW